MSGDSKAWDLDQAEAVGKVEVRITSKEVHRAVRNIMANEMNLDAEVVKEELRKKMYDHIEETAIKLIDSKAGYRTIDLESRVGLAIGRVIGDCEKTIEKMVQKAVEVHVRKVIEEKLDGFLTAFVKNSEFRIGWKQTAKIELVPQETKDAASPKA